MIQGQYVYHLYLPMKRDFPHFRYQTQSHDTRGRKRIRVVQAMTEFVYSAPARAVRYKLLAGFDPALLILFLLTCLVPIEALWPLFVLKHWVSLGPTNKGPFPMLSHRPPRNECNVITDWSDDARLSGRHGCIYWSHCVKSSTSQFPILSVMTELNGPGKNLICRGHNLRTGNWYLPFVVHSLVTFTAPGIFTMSSNHFSNFGNTSLG